MTEITSAVWCFLHPDILWCCFGLDSLDDGSFYILNPKRSLINITLTFPSYFILTHQSTQFFKRMKEAAFSAANRSEERCTSLPLPYSSNVFFFFFTSAAVNRHHPHIWISRNIICRLPPEAWWLYRPQHLPLSLLCPCLSGPRPAVMLPSSARANSSGDLKVLEFLHYVDDGLCVGFCFFFWYWQSATFHWMLTLQCYVWFICYEILGEILGETRSSCLFSLLFTVLNVP